MVTEMAMPSMQKRSRTASRRAGSYRRVRYEHSLPSTIGFRPEPHSNTLHRCIHLHPGIVVGRLHHMEIVPFTHFRSMLVKVRDLLEPSMSVDE